MRATLAVVLLALPSLSGAPTFEPRFRADQIKPIDPVKSYQEGRRQRQEAELAELEIEQRKAELEAMDRRRQEERKQQNVPDLSTTVMLRCTFSGSNDGQHYVPTETVMLRVNSEGIALRSGDGWSKAPNEILEDRMWVVGQFVKTNSAAGGEAHLPKWSYIVIDRYFGDAVVYTRPSEADGNELPLFEGRCDQAKRLF